MYCFHIVKKISIKKAVMGKCENENMKNVHSTIFKKARLSNLAYADNTVNWFHIVISPTKESPVLVYRLK